MNALFLASSFSSNKLWAIWAAWRDEQFQSSVEKAVTVPAFGSSHGPDNEDILDVALADNEKVNKMPLLGSRMYPCGFVFGCHSEQGVRDDYVILAQWQEAVVVHLANAMSAKHLIILILVLHDSGVEVFKQNKVIAGRNRVQNRTEVSVDLLDCLL